MCCGFHNYICVCGQLNLRLGTLRAEPNVDDYLPNIFSIYNSIWINWICPAVVHWLQRRREDLLGLRWKKEITRTL